MVSEGTFHLSLGTGVVPLQSQTAVRPQTKSRIGPVHVLAPPFSTQTSSLIPESQILYGEMKTAVVPTF